MLKNISNIGSVLNKAEQKSIIGGVSCPKNDYERCNEECPEGSFADHECFVDCMEGDCSPSDYYSLDFKLN